MKTSTGLPYRQSIRLPYFDYSRSEMYFVTICTFRHQILFGDIVDGRVELNVLGNIVRTEWLRTPLVRPNVTLDLFEVMPDHMHALLLLDGEGSGPIPKEFRCRPRSLSSTIRGFKGKTTAMIREHLGEPQFKVWQSKFFDQIVVNDQHLDRVRDYILQNPATWKRP